MIMKLLWLSHLIPYPPKGGVLQRSFYLLRELSKHHEIDLLAFNQKDLIAPLYKGDIERGLVDAHQELSKICNVVEFFDIECDSKAAGKRLLALTSLFSRYPYTINWLRSETFSKTLSEKISRESYDLVHLDTISLDIYRPLLGNLPCVLDHHNIESHMLLRRSRQEKSLVKKAYFFQEGVRLQRFEKRVCPEYWGHITCSDIDSERLRMITASSDIKTIPNGVDTNFFAPKGLKQDDKTLVFVGTMSWYPNIEAAFFICNEIMPRLRLLRSGVRLQIIGANPPEQLRKFALKHDDIDVLGFVDEVRDYIEKATVYVCPIMDGGGTKLKILDALAMEKPIIAHKIASEGINVTDGLDILLADQADEYAELIVRLIESSTERVSLGKAARKLALEHYDYTSIGKSLSDYYVKLVGS
jgi:glycosyltransferase involved in cell wall biosynthesis